MHKLLARQILRQFGSLEAVPKELMPFIEAVDAAYLEGDKDRFLLERAMEISSQELVERNTLLRREVAERARSEDALRQSETRLHEIIDLVPHMIFAKDSAGRFLLANRAVGEAYGISVEELLAKPQAHFHPSPGEAARFLADDREVLETNQPKVIPEEPFTDAAGRRRLLQVTKIPMLEPATGERGVLGVAIDVTEARLAEERLQQAYARLKELDRFRAQFLNNAAHELGTPLTPIKIQIHLLRESLGATGTEAQQRNLQTLERNLERLGALVKDLLDAARLQTARMQLDMRPHDLNDEIRDAVDAFQGLARERGVSLGMTSAVALPVLGDARRLGQVFYNLVSNALKFTPKGGEVRLSARREGDEILVSVKDSGQGIKPDLQNRLFEPFSQVHDTLRQEAAAGTGLGLYISRGIVEEHGGRIWAHSDGLGKGTTFSFTLPLLHERAAPRASGGSGPTSS